MHLPRVLAVLLLLAGVISLEPAALAAGAPDSAQRSAEQALMSGRLDQAVGDLRGVLAASPNDGPAQLLLCRAFYAEGALDPAIAACQSAVRDQPSSSEAEDWLGRAYGMKANTAGMMASYQLARKVKIAFAAAVALDPHNPAAVNDLSEFDIDAPVVLGGSLARAMALAASIQAQFPQQADRIRALVAENRSDFGAAEHEFQAAVAVAGRPDAWSDLGDFYTRRKQYDRAVDALKHCIQADGAKNAAMVDAAAILIKIHREPQLAEQALREYLSDGDRSDAAPAPRAEVMLAQLLAANGDKAGAKIEVEKALHLASNYAPARLELKALQQS